MRYLLVGLLFWSSQSILAQPTDFVPENKIYVDYIKSVKFHITGLSLSMPMVELGSAAPLILKFDDLNSYETDYAYTLVHYDADWTRSALDQMEYIDGYQEADIENFEYGYNTFVSFTHYQLQLPNRDMQFNKSGNYLLVVYDVDTDEVVLTRRFCVIEPRVQIVTNINVPSNVSKNRTHQEIDFNVLHRDFPIRSPQQEITATIIQNKRWGTAISGIKPLFIRPQEMRFDYQDKLVFPAGNEFRNLNLRSFQFRTESMFEIDDSGPTTSIVLKLDEKREYIPYGFVRDLNGGFVVENSHYDQFDLESDYGNVVFTLETVRPFPNSDVYVVGDMTDWQLDDANRMSFDESYGAYQGDLFLKQGWYNYHYAIKDRKTGKVSYQQTEGNFFQTENEYTILLYYRPFGERYDRLIAVQTANSNIQ